MTPSPGKPSGPPAGGEADVHAEVAEVVADDVLASQEEERTDGVAGEVSDDVLASQEEERTDGVAGEVSDDVLASQEEERTDGVAGEVSDEVAAGRAAVAPSDPFADAWSSDPLGGEAADPLGDPAPVAAEVLAAERLSDLQRLQAEYVNYRRRVERDRSVARDSAVASVLEGVLGVLDDIELARQHGDLEGGPFAAIAEKLETALGRFGLSRFGAAGEPFDPSVHDALMHAHSDDVDVATVTQVLQPGYRIDDKVLRAARVAVSDPH